MISVKARYNADSQNDAVGYVSTEPCIGTRDTSCVDVCPVDCGACVSACRVKAIYADADVPQRWAPYMAIQADYFK